jgi:hypothetical protein
MFEYDTKKLVGEIEDTHRCVKNTMGRPKMQLAGFKTGSL